ncbi:MAG: hypothetical protein F9K29_15945 [Hyphomicrobiaceae bacterium]|nr:MAG: hypothetical protein F9K29_15945 [Hyphomicrobiaceae bacterium]
MRRSIALAVCMAAAALLGSHAGASAQSVGIEIYTGPPPAPYAYSYEPSHRVRYGYRPHVYGYVRDDDRDDADIVIERPAYRGGCGIYRYWNGERCVDARYED